MQFDCLWGGVGFYLFFFISLIMIVPKNHIIKTHPVIEQPTKKDINKILNSCVIFVPF